MINIYYDNFCSDNKNHRINTNEHAKRLSESFKFDSANFFFLRTYELG